MASRIPRQANSRDYWREAGARRRRVLTANARVGRRITLNFGFPVEKAQGHDVVLDFGPVWWNIRANITPERRWRQPKYHRGLWGVE